MPVVNEILSALLDRGVTPSISNSMHRKGLEDLADKLLKLYPETKQALDYSKNTNPLDYLRAKTYNKRLGSQRAFDTAIERTQNQPKTRVFSEQEMEKVYKPWHQKHGSQKPATKSKLFEEMLDEIEGTGEIIREANPRWVGENDSLLDVVELLSSAHQGNKRALKKVRKNTSDKMSRMKDLYKAMYERKGRKGIDQLVKIDNQQPMQSRMVDVLINGKQLTVDPNNKHLSPAIIKALSTSE